MKDKILQLFNQKGPNIWVDELTDIEHDQINSGKGKIDIWDEGRKMGLSISFEYDVVCVQPYEHQSYWHPGHPEILETNYNPTSVVMYDEEGELGEIMYASNEIITEIIETHTL